jgi:N-acetylglutamate synthase-like GNAT family acetyltransferase
MRVIMSTTIRPAIESDQDEIKSMVRAARINPRNLHWGRFLVAEDGGRIVGIRQVKIHKELMRAILAREPDPLYLMCDQKWAHYYEQFGFLRVEPSELPPDFRKEYRTGRIITSVLSLFVRRDIRLIPMKRET